MQMERSLALYEGIKVNSNLLNRIEGDDILKRVFQTIDRSSSKIKQANWTIKILV